MKAWEWMVLIIAAMLAVLIVAFVISLLILSIVALWDIIDTILEGN